MHIRYCVVKHGSPDIVHHTEFESVLEGLPRVGEHFEWGEPPTSKDRIPIGAYLVKAVTRRRRFGDVSATVFLEWVASFGV